MKILYTDASFDWKHAEETPDNVVRGKIAISDGESFNRIEKVVVGKVEGLKQYINIMELTAIARAVEFASVSGDIDLLIYSDSQVAVNWARKNKIPKKVTTPAHVSALDYLRASCLSYKSKIEYKHIPREHNPAGHLLAEELKKEPPHTR